jgi:hypothetical protein
MSDPNAEDNQTLIKEPTGMQELQIQGGVHTNVLKPTGSVFAVGNQYKRYW